MENYLAGEGTRGVENRDLTTNRFHKCREKRTAEFEETTYKTAQGTEETNR
jgi:hypothetical protein